MPPPWITYTDDDLLVLARALWPRHDAGSQGAAALARAVVEQVARGASSVGEVSAAVRAALADTPGSAGAGLHLGVATRGPAGWQAWTTGLVAAFARAGGPWQPLTRPRTLARRSAELGQAVAPETAVVATHLAEADVSPATFETATTPDTVALAGGPWADAVAPSDPPSDDPESAWLEPPLSADAEWRALWAQRDTLLAPAREWWLALGEPVDGFRLAEGLVGFEDALASSMILGAADEAADALAPLEAAWPAVRAAVDCDRSLIPELGAAALAVAALSRALPAALSVPDEWFADLVAADPPLPPARRRALGAALGIPGHATAGPQLRGWPPRQGRGQTDFADLALAGLVTLPGTPPERLVALRRAVRRAAGV